MTTITIKNSKRFSKTEFENLSDLQDYISLQLSQNQQEFSSEYKNELDKREKQLLSGEVKGILWEEIKSEFLSE